MLFCALKGKACVKMLGILRENSFNAYKFTARNYTLSQKTLKFTAQSQKFTKALKFKATNFFLKSQKPPKIQQIPSKVIIPILVLIFFPMMLFTIFAVFVFFILFVLLFIAHNGGVFGKSINMIYRGD